MGEIFNVKQHTGQRGRPKEVEVYGANKKEVGDVEILGASTPTNEPTIISRGTKQEPKDEKAQGNS